MAFFNEYPYRNLTDFNLDYLYREMQTVKKSLKEYLERSTITFHDPITWDITDQYTANTMVIDNDGTAYLSVQPVPAGIDITNTNYWQPVFNYDDQIHTVMGSIAEDTRTTGVLQNARQAGELVWYNETIYVLTADLPAGSVIIPGSNADEVLLEEWAKGLIDALSTLVQINTNAIAAEVTARTNADAALSDRITAEVTARTDADNALGGRIDDEITDRTNADNSLGGRIDDEITDRTNADNALSARIAALGGNVTTLEEFHDGGEYWDTAMNRALVSGKPIMLTGTYKFAYTHIIPRGISFIGFGATINTGDFGLAAVLPNSLGDNTTDDGRVLFKLLGDNYVTGLKFNTMALPVRCAGDNISITDCSFTTVSSLQAGYDAYYAIDLKDATNVRISNVSVNMLPGGWRDGIHINGNCSKIEISDCVIISGDDPIAMNAPEENSGTIHDVNISNCYLSGYGVRLYSKNASTKIYNINFSNCQIIGKEMENISAAAIRFIQDWGMEGGGTYTGVYEDISFSNCTIKNEHANYPSMFFTDCDATRVNIVNCSVNNIGVQEDGKVDYFKITNSACDSIDLSGIDTASTIQITNTTAYIITGASHLRLFLSGVMASHISIATGSSDNFLKAQNCSFYGTQLALLGSGEFLLSGCRFSNNPNPIANEGGSFIVRDCDNIGGSNVLTNLAAAARYVGIAYDNTIHPTNPVAGDVIYYVNLGGFEYYNGVNWQTL